MLIITILLLISLVSYNSHDTSFNALFYKPYADNLVGRVGAWISDQLYQFLGFSAFLLVVPLATLGWKFLRGREVQSPVSRTLGLFLLICSLSTALQLLPFRRQEANFEPGGA